MQNETVVVLDFGGQYSRLIARRVREQNVYCEVLPCDTPAEAIREKSPKGLILTGGPANVYDADSPKCDDAILKLGIPVLGICYGMQLIASLLGGRVAEGGSANKEYGKTNVRIDKSCILFRDFEEENVCWMSHTDYVAEIPEGFTRYGASGGCPIAAMGDERRKIFAVQFHPEVAHTVHGTSLLNAFLYNVCGCSGDWNMSGFTERSIQSLRERIGDSKVILALSGGVDSAVAAAMVSKAVGKKLTCIFVDHGLMRKNERQQIEAVFGSKFDSNLVIADAQTRFLEKLKGVSDPETKRVIIGREFIEVFQDEAKKLGAPEDFYFVQGTIYPDVIESGAGKSAVIKKHHNVGGLPKHLKFKAVIEPLRDLFKDEVRKCGFELGLTKEIVMRQPFPGPGLAVRILGDLTKERLDLLRDADFIFREEIAKAGWEDKVSQSFAVLTNIRSVGVMGDERTYDYTIALRAVTTTDFMTADWAQLPYELLQKASTRIVNEVRGVNRVVYDITSKPPATIEWE
ncbi:MAG: glutamine-hydrolyzing GMP synthase [Clostridia bacterium]